MTDSRDIVEYGVGFRVELIFFKFLNGILVDNRFVYKIY